MAKQKDTKQKETQAKLIKESLNDIKESKVKI